MFLFECFLRNDVNKDDIIASVEKEVLKKEQLPPIESLNLSSGEKNRLIGEYVDIWVNTQLLFLENSHICP